MSIAHVTRAFQDSTTDMNVRSSPTTHNPQQFVTGLGSKLATRSRHICLLLGAGAAKACGLPDVCELQERVRLELGDGNPREAFDRQLAGRNIEQALSRLRRIAGLISGDDRVDGLTAAEAAILDAAICQAIVKALDTSKADSKPMLDLAAWSARAGYRLPVELFTVNYDLLVETALESISVPYFDGFVGNIKARFRTDLVESLPGTDGGSLPSQFVRLWKLHGSVNWARDQCSREVVRMGAPVPGQHAAAIYPSDSKYEESRRLPFVALQDRFRRALNEPETLVLIAGYSFGDAHLNEVIFDAATRRERSEFVVFFYADLTAELCERARRTPNLQIVGRTRAVIGGVEGSWKPPSESVPSIWDGSAFTLPDFRCLAAYLARSTTRDMDAQYSRQVGLERTEGGGEQSGTA